MLDRSDLTIGSSPTLFAALGAELMARRFKVPFIFETRDIWPEGLIQLGKSSKHHPLTLILRFLEIYLLQRCSAVITALPGSVEYMVNNGINKNKVLWLPNSVDLKMTPEHIHNINNDGFLALYTGSFNKANDLYTVLHAAEILQKQGYSNKIKIRLIGDGPEKSKLLEMANERNISMIEFHEPVLKKNLYQQISKADVCLSLRLKSDILRSTRSLKVPDYLIMGKPIIFCGLSR